MCMFICIKQKTTSLYFFKMFLTLIYPWILFTFTFIFCNTNQFLMIKTNRKFNSFFFSYLSLIRVACLNRKINILPIMLNKIDILSFLSFKMLSFLLFVLFSKESAIKWMWDPSLKRNNYLELINKEALNDES